MDDIEGFERSQRRSRRIKFSILGLVLASPFLWLGWTCHKRTVEDEEWEAENRRQNALSASEKTELDKLIPDLRRRVQAAAKAFAEDVTPAKLETVVPGDARCPQHVRELDVDADRYTAYSGGGVTTYKPGEVPQAFGAKSNASSLEEIAQEIQREGEPTKSHLQRTRDLADEVGIEVFLVGEVSEPVVLADSYVPGRVRGTVFVYSAEARKVVCAADIDVENASEVNIEYTTSNYDVTGAGNKRAAATSKLEQDLGQRTRQAIRASLRAVR